MCYNNPVDFLKLCDSSGTKFMEQYIAQKEQVRISQILEHLISEISGDHVTIGEIIDNLKHRGFGPILVVLSLFVIIAGAIPLVPAIIGFVIVLISMQMLLGSEHLWIPHKLKHLKINKSKLAHCISFAKPYTKKLEHILKMRLLFFFNRTSEIITAIVCLALAILMIVIGFIPMVPAVFCLPIFLFGIGYTAQDGLFIALGFLIIFGIIWLWFFT